MNHLPMRRILLIDDMPAIHQDFRKILCGAAPATSELDLAEAALFGELPRAAGVSFELDSAFQGQEGLAMTQQALAAGRPYALAFVDMRMPPGWDGIETVEHLWQVDPQLQIVICTAYSDYSWDQMLARLDVGDRLLVLKKPFDTIEVSQLAGALTAKRELARRLALKMADLEAAIAARTADLSESNASLRREIEERKQLQSQLVQSEKMASLGQLAAGVAHEINNPLSFVLSNVGVIGDHVDTLLSMVTACEAELAASGSALACARLADLRANLDLPYLIADMPALMRETLDGVVRVRQIVQDLRDFSRVDSGQDWQLADVHQGIDSTLNIVGGELKYAADIVKQYGVLPQIECLPSQLNQVIMNLVMNAAHACGTRRGTITIRTGSEVGQVWIEVSDTGSGIAPDTLPHIFDPFFTTKAVGKGTGLGLSVSHGIVQKHRGRIDVHSTPGQGSCFRVVLPVAQRAAAAGGA